MVIKVKSVCGEVKLLEAILGELPNRYQLYDKYGIPYSKCLYCDKPIPDGKEFCDSDCKYLYHQIPVRCSECGRIFHIYKSELMHRLNNRKVEEFFCSNICKGKHAGKNYGFAAHPQNIKDVHKGHTKWNYDEIYQLQDKNHLSYREISRILNIPYITIWKILAKRNKNESSSTS